MADENQKAVDEYIKSGVDLEDLKEPEQEKKPEVEPKVDPKPEPTVVEKKDEEPKVDPDPNPDDKNIAPLQDNPTPPRKRSIYDEYKDKKSELKTQTELREKAEKDRDEALQKLADLGASATHQDKQDAGDAVEKFAKSIGADPATIKQFRDLILNDVKPSADQGLAERLSRFEAWEKSNSMTIEKSLFAEDFTKITPQLKQLFPTVNATELEAIKTELDTISHTKDWHDKDLGYVAFMHKDKLASLVSPKKRGLEGQGRKETMEESTDFNPEADFASMTPAERAKWEEDYKKTIGSSPGLITKEGGGKILL